MTMKTLFEEINTTHVDNLLYLRERWEDESQYEDINDYLDAIKKSIPCASEISGHPFSFKCLCDDGELEVHMPIRGNKILIQGFLNPKEPDQQHDSPDPKSDLEMGGL